MLHTFGFCFHTQRLQTVWVAGTEEGDYLRLIPAEGDAIRYRPRQLIYRWQSEGPPMDDAAARELLRGRIIAMEAQARQLDLATLQQGLEPEIEQPAERYLALAMESRLLPPEPEGWDLAALFLALLRDNTRFRRGESGFAPRTPGEQQARAARLAAARSQEAWAAKARGWAEDLEQGRWSGGVDPDAPRFLAELVSLVALEKRSPHWNALAKPLVLHGRHAHDAAPTLRRWLEAAGGWPGWPEIWLARADVQRGFPPEVVALAASMAATPVRTDRREDLSGIAAYTLDAVDTFDYDDAYSVLESDANGITVAVHIAEPAPDLAPGHPVFDAAAQRISTVYTPGAIFPMLPAALSLGRFSLQKGELREVVTCRMRLTAKGAEPLGIARGLIRVAENLDYGRAEDLVQAEPDTWGRLVRLAESLTRARIASGAVVTERREVVLNLADPAHIRMERRTRHGGVHRVIEELAIAYNTTVGAYCRQHELPAIYRVQSLRKATPEPGVTTRPMLPPARYSTHGARHAGLGADRYVHATSPLRRFPDLVIQRQVAEHVATGRVAFPDLAQLEAWADHAETRQSAYDDVERAIDEHWLRVWLTQNPGSELPATVRRNDHGHGRVWLDELLMTVDAKLPPYSRPGSPVRVRVTEVDLDAQRVRVETVD